MTRPDSTLIPDSGEFTHSAAKQLGVYAIFTIIGLTVLMYLLSLAAGNINGGSGISGINVEENSITITLGQEPPQLDSGRATDAASFSVLAHAMEGLITYDQNNQLVPGVAQRWEIREDGATFWIREDASWNDGRRVTAHDFVFAWERVVDPVTASEYAFILYPIKNAEKINQGKLSKESLGVYARSNQILEVEFEQPTPYFDKLVAFNTYYPVRKDFFESTNGRYGADADMLLYNGPYMVTEWVHGSSMLWEKNPYYWSDEKGFLNRIIASYITTDVNTKINLFKDGQIADTSLVAPMLPQAMEQRWQIDRVMDGTVFFLEFNHREGRITSNLNFRKALSLAQDPNELVYKVLKEAAYLPAQSLFPVWVQGVNEQFRKEYPPKEHKIDVLKAREYLELARQELGLDEFPPIVFLTGDTPISLLASEYYQQLYLENLGLEIRIDAQIFKQRLAKMTSGEFDVVMAGWGPDYFDPLTFGDLFASWNLNNRGRYNNAEMDKMVRIAQSELDPRIRMNAMGSIQSIIEEDVALIPMYERGVSFVVDPRLKGLIRRVVGPEVDYNYAYIDVSED
jgi:oligopeptide transport system substrate-binding protein